MCARVAGRSRPYTREEVIEVLKQFPEIGIKNPDDLDLDDKRVQRVNEAVDNWYSCIDSRESVEADLEVSLSRSTLYVDAGFDDPAYLDEVANDWLLQDEQRALQHRLIDLAAKIHAKRDEINQTLGYGPAIYPNP